MVLNQFFFSFTSSQILRSHSNVIKQFYYLFDSQMTIIPIFFKKLSIQDHGACIYGGHFIRIDEFNKQCRNAKKRVKLKDCHKERKH